MAERNISVRLSARVDSYIAAMEAAKASTASLSATSQANLTKLGGQMQTLGRNATRYVTVPILALGAGAVAMGARFEQSFAQMEGLANVPAAEIEALKESVLDLAGETSVAPQELAEALYFAASAGLDSAAAMDAVALAAKASAAGMGSAADVTGLVASAVASYGEANISAAEATDILTATIREGRAEPAELAATLGRVLPIASQMGITFAEVGGATAFLTNIMGGADIATTALRDALVKLSAPTEGSKQVLLEMGTSFGELQAAISQDGLLGALELLRAHGFEGNSEALHALMPDIQGYTALSALLSDESGRLAGTIDTVTNSQGALGTAFSAVADTDAFKMKQAITDIKVAMTEAGGLMLPIVADIASSIAGLAGWFTDLDPAVQGVVLAFAGLMAAAGPLTFVAGTLLKNWVSIAGAFGLAEAPAARLGKALGVMGLVAGAAVLAWNILGEGNLNASAHIDTASDALARETSTAYAAALMAGEATTSVDALAIAHIALSNAIADAAGDELTDAFARLNVAADDTLETLIALGPASGSLEATAMRVQLTADAFGVSTEEAEIWLGVMDSGTETTETLAQILGVTTGEVESFQDALFTVTGYAIENKQEVNDLTLAYLDSIPAMGGAAREALLAAEGIAGGRTAAMNAVPVFMEFVHQLTLLDPAAASAILAVDGLPPSIQALIDPATEAAGAVEELEDVAASSIDTMSNYASWMETVARVAGIYDDALQDALGTGGQWIREHDDFQTSLRGFGELIEESSAGVNGNSDAVDANRDAVLDLADDLTALTASNLKSGMATTEVTAEYQKGREALLDAAEAAGLNRGEVEALITAYGLTPELITTTMNIAGDALNQWALDRYLEKLDTVPPEIATQMELLVNEGDVAGAIALFESIPDQTVWITARLANPGFRLGVSNGQVTYSFGAGSMQAAALGAYVASDGIWQLHANEAVMPLDNPVRMRQLADDPRIGGPLLAALGNLMPAPSFAGFGGGQSGVRSDLPAIYVYNNGDRNITPHDIARAIAESRAA